MENDLEIINKLDQKRNDAIYVSLDYCYHESLEQVMQLQSRYANQIFIISINFSCLHFRNWPEFTRNFFVSNFCLSKLRSSRTENELWLKFTETTTTCTNATCFPTRNICPSTFLCSNKEVLSSIRDTYERVTWPGVCVNARM